MTDLRPAQIIFPIKGANESADAYLTRLQAPLQSLTNLIVGLTSGAATTVYDDQGRPIQTPQGNYAYGIDGSTVVAPDIVQIDTQDIVDAAVGEDQIANLAVGTAKIKDAAIVSAKIGLLQVVTANIDDAAINNAKIANVSAGKLTAGTIATNAIYIGGSQLELDGTNTVIKIKDAQASPVTRVELGKLGAGSTAYGLTIRDASGNVILTSGSSPTISGTFIDTITASQVTAGTFTGFTFQTASSGTRSVLSTSTNDFRAYDSGGNVIASIGAGVSFGGQVYATSGSSLTAAAVFLNSAGGRALTVSSNAINAETALFVCTGPLSAAVSGTTTANVNAGFFKNNTGSLGGHGLRAQSSGGGSGIVGLPASQSGFAFYAETGAYGPFTGSHDALIEKTASSSVGDIVVDQFIVARSGLSDTIAAALPSSSANQKGAVGVLVNRQPLGMRTAAMRDLTDEEFEALQDTYDLISMNAVGEGQMVVCGEGGDLGIGDLIVTSSTAGLGMKQADDQVRACTVAKSREVVTFASPTETKTIAVFYVGG